VPLLAKFTAHSLRKILVAAFTSGSGAPLWIAREGAGILILRRGQFSLLAIMHHPDSNIGSLFICHACVQ
jgi:hypothetical protein